MTKYHLIFNQFFPHLIYPDLLPPEPSREISTRQMASERQCPYPDKLLQIPSLSEVSLHQRDVQLPDTRVSDYNSCFEIYFNVLLTNKQSTA